MDGRPVVREIDSLPTGIISLQLHYLSIMYVVVSNYLT